MSAAGRIRSGDRHDARLSGSVSGNCGTRFLTKEKTKMAKKNTTQQQTVKSASSRKPLGTRLGTIEDWRGASGKSGKLGGRYGSAVRDGR